MTKDKWLDAFDKAFEKHGERLDLLNEDITPENWPEAKASSEKLIKEVDEATEVYNMENTEK